MDYIRTVPTIHILLIKMKQVKSTCLPSYWINCEADVRPAFVFGVKADQEINAKKVFDLFTGITTLFETSVLTTDNIFHA